VLLFRFTNYDLRFEADIHATFVFLRVHSWLNRQSAIGNQKCLLVIVPAACDDFHLVLQIYIRYISIYNL